MSRHLLPARLSPVAATAKVMPSPRHRISRSRCCWHRRDRPRVIARTARKQHGRCGGNREDRRAFWRVRERSRVGTAVAFSGRVTVRTSRGGSQRCRLDGDVQGDGMQRLVRVMRRVVTSVLVIWLVSLAAPCAAQELDAPAAPAAPDARDGRGSRIRARRLSRTLHSCTRPGRSKRLRLLLRRSGSTGGAGGRPCSDDEVSDDYSQLSVLRGSSKRP